MWWRTRHGRGPPARHHLLDQLPGPAEHPCRVPLAAAHTPGTAPFSRPCLNTHERSGEEPFKRSSEAQNPRSHTAPASLQRSRTLVNCGLAFFQVLHEEVADGACEHERRKRDEKRMEVPATFGAAWEMEVGWPSRAVLRKKALDHGKGRWLKTVVTCRKSLGCGSSGGASRRVRNDVAGVAGLVDAVAFLGEVVAPVVFEVAVAAKRAEPEDGLGTAESPAGAGEVHPVFDQVAAGAFDDPGGDR